MSADRDLSSVNPPTLAEVVKERDHLRAAVEEAVRDLSPHRPWTEQDERLCICGDMWPCDAAMTADDLRAALETR